MSLSQCFVKSTTHFSFLPSTSVVSDKVTPGRHILTCEIVESTKDPGGGHEFRLIAIDSA